MFKPILIAISTSALALPAAADDITDTLNSAIQAYEEGDIQYALEELAFAEQLLNELKAGELTGFLPEAPEGWTREIDEDQMAGLAAFGQGTGVAARYEGDGEEFSLTIMADNPMVASMAGIFGNSAIMASQGKLLRVGREKFLEQRNGQIMGLVDNRILIQVEGAPADVVVPILETMDFRELGRFGL